MHLGRTKFLWNGVCYERLRVSNFGLVPIETDVILDFAADYADIFEVRGSKRERRGARLEELVEGPSVTLGCQGLDGVARRTRLVFDPIPDALSGRQAVYRCRLAPRQTATLYVALSCETDRLTPVPLPHDDAFAALQAGLRGGHLTACRVSASDGDLNDWIARSVSDLQMMITETPQGPYPYAGVPWFSTPFGRDGIITAIETLWIAPDVARGVLAYLAVTQATDYAPERDAQPGKILHEARGGEMAALGEVPFGRYYGSVDATPLYVVLAAAYWRRTGDLAFLRTIAPNVERALGWIEKDGDLDGDGFVEYARQTPTGLVQQGWKDSHDSVFHADGTAAEGAHRPVRGAGVRLRRLARGRRDRAGARPAERGPRPTCAGPSC